MSKLTPNYARVSERKTFSGAPPQHHTRTVNAVNTVQIIIFTYILFFFLPCLLQEPKRAKQQSETAHKIHHLTGSMLLFREVDPR